MAENLMPALQYNNYGGGAASLKIVLITLAIGPFIVAAGGISNIFLHRLVKNIQDAYAEAASIAEPVFLFSPGSISFNQTYFS
ncbi:hypothetical protein ERO13_D04G086050v2 [Gossypium hirsutum]|uniref:Uncharacterized protein n=1 Tax=Gossypium darwinii TaxID=34276 RepID=A0A5D2CZQ1_GOSDA|nr:hypothetical protein ERO13_D04G086050v2 [Gossypium hirsutum]TYG73463.1 hypothetical protein ES288_D04G102900v1 [Gossypium darwinii]